MIKSVLDIVVVFKEFVQSYKLENNKCSTPLYMELS